MNKFSFTKKDKTTEPQKVEITLSDAIHDAIMAPLKETWLLPILQGERKELGDGMTYYCFYLPDEDAEILKAAFFKAYSIVTGHDTPN